MNILIKSLIFITILAVVIFKSLGNTPSISFYHWQNSFNLSKYEIKTLKELKSKKIYLKIYDIIYKKNIELVPVKIGDTKDYEIIPVIYIENQLFLTQKNRDSFANTLLKKIKKKIKNLKVKEIQFDCDWSLKSKKNYFYFLKKMKKELKLKISATIRLHQVKYHKKIGVPPIDSGVLMYYNMSNISDFDTANSILDNKIAKKYHYNFDTYPLFLDIALPIYSQGVLFRYKEVVFLIEGVEKNDFENKNFASIGKNRFKAVKSHYFKGNYIYKNDIIRFENSSLNELKIASENLSKIVKQTPKNVIFYRLDEKFLKKIKIKEFKNIVDNFN